MGGLGSVMGDGQGMHTSRAHPSYKVNMRSRCSMPGGSVKLTSQVTLEKWLAARAICVRMRCWSSECKHVLN